MSKAAVLFCCVLLFAGYANAQDLCTLAKAVIPSGVTCTGTGAAATLTASVTVPTGALPTELTFAMKQNPCNPATASFSITDSRKAFLTSGSVTLDVKNGQNNIDIPGASLAVPVVGTVKARVEIVLTGGINADAGLTFSAGLGVCLDAKCNKDVATIFSAFPLPLVPSFTMKKDLFTADQLKTLCPSSSSSLHASLALVILAISALFF
jgi:hypothetical protein